jgi:formylglycine-generating enzyme required for sulfatase activity
MRNDTSGWRRRAAGRAGLAAVLIGLAALAGCAGEDGVRHERLGSMDFVYLPPGSFQMGSHDAEPERRPSEILHEVTIRQGFWIGTTEVTQAQWLTVAEDNPSAFPGPDRPVERISWYDAVAYCNALSRRDGLRPCYRIDGKVVTWDRTADGYRLPTEEEWEYACRAGTTTAFANGRCLTVEDANVDCRSQLPRCAEAPGRGETVPVGGFPPNAWGLHDMHGNVEEWCWDLYRKDPRTASPDTVLTTNAEPYRCLRGGGFSSPPARCRSAARGATFPRIHSDQSGLRLARSAPAGAAR